MQLRKECTLTSTNEDSPFDLLCVEMIDRKLNDFIKLDENRRIWSIHRYCCDEDNNSTSTIVSSTITTTSRTSSSLLSIDLRSFKKRKRCHEQARNSIVNRLSIRSSATIHRLLRQSIERRLSSRTANSATRNRESRFANHLRTSRSIITFSRQVSRSKLRASMRTRY